jgi:hypothetical protein
MKITFTKYQWQIIGIKAGWIKSTNLSKKAGKVEEDEEYAVQKHSFEMMNEERNKILREFNEARKLRKAKPYSQPWPVIPAARLTKIWNDYSKTGIVRDERGLDEIVDRVLRNIFRLHANTELVGHTPGDPREMYSEDLEYHGIKNEKDYARLVYYIQDDKYSDYAMKPLLNIALSLMKAKTAEEKLLLVDQALNVIHQRGDIAAIFVEGGSKTLNQLFERPYKTTASCQNWYKISLLCSNLSKEVGSWIQ